MFGLEIPAAISIILLVGQLANTANESVSLGKNVVSLLNSFIVKKESSEIERKFFEVIPVVTLIRKKLAARLLVISSTVIITVIMFVFYVGRFSNNSIDRIVDTAVVIIAIFIAVFMFFPQIKRKILINPSEAAILKYSEERYVLYIIEKTIDYKAFSKIVLDILEFLNTTDKKNRKSLDEVRNYLKSKNHTFTNDELRLIMEKLKNKALVKAKDDGYYTK